MNWQDVIVYIIVACCFVWVIHRTLFWWKRAEKNDNPCASCVSGCDLKRMMDQKQQECRENQIPKEKNCCK